MMTSRFFVGGLARERADHVVGFVAGIFEDRQAHGFAIAADEGKLQRKILGHGRALRFVVGEKLVAKSGRGDVEDHGEVIGLLFAQQA